MLQVPAKMGSYNFGTWQGPVAVMVIPLDEELRHDKNIYRDHVRVRAHAQCVSKEMQIGNEATKNLYPLRLGGSRKSDSTVPNSSILFF